MRRYSIFLLLLSFAFVSACTEVELASHVAKQIPPFKPAQSSGTFKVGKPYRIAGKLYHPKESYELVETGIASWYGPNFHGKPTANGEIFDQNELTAAHRTLQLPSLVRVTNLGNGRSLVVRVNDRGPFSKGRIIDLSKRAADLLGYKNQGTAKVKLEVLPEESLQIAELAKLGKSTAGTEIALNEQLKGTRRKPAVPPLHQDRTITLASARPEDVQFPNQPPQAISRVELKPLTPEPVKGHFKRNTFYPDPVVHQVPVKPSTIYVQTGSFSNPTNANRLAQSLRNFGSAQVQPANIQGKTYYRVRIPARSVSEADTLLAQLSNAGKPNALIVVE